MIRTALAGLLALFSFIGPAYAEDPPGRFDFYVLALSWSPGFCALGDNRTRRIEQCAKEKRHGFVVHGLWPQYERGYPEYCGRAAWVPDRLIREMQDIMPTRGLVIGQWRKHGTCAGMEPAAYFQTLRRAYERIRVPTTFTHGIIPARLSPDEVETAFAAANPDLEKNMMAVQCGERTLSEVRICMTHDLAFRACPEVERHACPLAAIRVPPPGGTQ